MKIESATSGCGSCILGAVIPDTISREIDIDAPPEIVWRIVTDAQHLAGWLSDEIEIDLRPGGAMLLTWHGHGTYQARVETVDPPRTFAFRWVLREGVEPLPGSSTQVVMTITPRTGGSRLRVVESGFGDLTWPEPEQARCADEHRQGWIVELDELRIYATRIAGSQNT
jgi:uncharacterized protein YndB with AHSA1/START domain